MAGIAGIQVEGGLQCLIPENEWNFP